MNLGKCSGSLLASCAVVLIASGCGESVQGTATPDIDREDPLVVIETALETMFTWRPAEDESGAAALERAAPYLGPELGSQTVVSQPGPGSQWEQWKRDQATVRADAAFLADEHPPDSDDTVHRVLSIRQSATTPNDLLIDENEHVAWAIATRGDDGWRLTSLQF
ncbi:MULTISPECIES: hypothetical protein [Rhodococcus]|uniref:hypothetical protein n=1 Tax=Rhodococcus TaxID=1827 RepID=UPI00193C8532|nr:MULTISPECIES: hypothetical protein [Rhodococcus]QRI78003.1 hypothetical protein JQ505_09930 [Rhodococcus aetherivorans]QSE61419.1 hypothetical protein JYA75_11040 [Rhodococcus sp. PSBB066]QSE67271.1 hypothetical protein JYA91_16550 [Rhodococcus sp. PSBB049]